MAEQVIYIVTIYGCNSTPSDMWTPESKLFEDYELAYAYFLKVSPSLHDKNNIAGQYINSEYKDMTNEYVIIEHRVQLAGYHDGEGNYAKRPEGAVIAKSVIKTK